MKSSLLQKCKKLLRLASVMFWGGICATGKTSLLFVRERLKMNQKYYQDNILKAVVDPRAHEYFDENP